MIRISIDPQQIFLSHSVPPLLFSSFCPHQGNGFVSTIARPVAAGYIFCHCFLFIYTVKQKIGTTFLLWINILIRNVIWQNLVLLLLMNIIIDVPYLIYGIYTNFRTFYGKKCDIGLRHWPWCLQKKIVLPASVYSFNFIITPNS